MATPNQLSQVDKDVQTAIATTDKMIPIATFKKLLGSAAAGLSNTEIEHIRDLEYRLGNIIFDAWLRNRNSPPNIAEAAEN
jgi:hypothetical protein